MFRSYIKIAFRSLAKNRLTSFINLFGLGLSMSVGLMIMVRLQDQLSYDRFHPHPERTYRIITGYHKKGGEEWKLASTPLPLKQELDKNKSLIEAAVNIYPAAGGKATADGKEIYINGAFTEPSFFNVFGFSLQSGDPATALQQPNAIVVSKSTSEKFFGARNPIGKVISIESKGSFIVTGVLNDAPGKSHIGYDAYASYSSIPAMEKNNQLPRNTSDWFQFNAAYTYVLLKADVATNPLLHQLSGVAKQLNSMNKDGVTSFHLQRLDKITPGTENLAGETSNGSSWSKIYFEIGVALLILFAACFNYTNLTIARALTRAKEVGIRKIVGAKRYQVFAQYVIESSLLAVMALSFAWLILAFIIRYAPFNDDYEFIPSTFRYNSTLIGWSLFYALFTGLFAGVAPAWILSAFKPLRVLKNLSTAKILGKISLQKALIVFQYTLSLTMIIFLFAFYKQFSFLSKLDPGFKRDQVLVVPINGLDENIVSQKISGVSGVKSVSASSARFNKHFSGLNAPVWISNKKEALALNYYYADKSFIPSMQFKMLAGTNFPSESGDEQYIVLNEKAIHALGFTDPYKAPGQKIWISDSTQLEITGVLKDFQYENAGKPIAPLAFRNKKNAYSNIYILTDGSDKAKIVKGVGEVWKELQPSPPFEYAWLDDTLEKNNAQTATISLLGFLVFIAISVASLGLLGLVVYTVEVKRKEISIRKIAGADKKQLVSMLSNGFIKLLFLAGLIATPIGFIGGFLFLQNFAERTSFGLLHLAACFLLVFGIGLITIISQTYKAASINPASTLRTE